MEQNYYKKYIKYKLKYLALKGGSKFLNRKSIDEYLNTVTNKLDKVDRDNIKNYIIKFTSEWEKYRGQLRRRIRQKESNNPSNNPILAENIEQLRELNTPITDINDGKLLEDIIYLVINKIDPSKPKEMEIKLEHMLNFKYAGLPLYSQLSEYQRIRTKMFIDSFNKKLSGKTPFNYIKEDSMSYGDKDLRKEVENKGQFSDKDKKKVNNPQGRSLSNFSLNGHVDLLLKDRIGVKVDLIQINGLPHQVIDH